jgi:hypothetical protein
MIQFIRLTEGRAIRGMIVDAALGAVCGALCGVSIGSFRLRLPGNDWSILPIVGYWALCVASIAVLVGTVHRIFEVRESSDQSAAPATWLSNSRRMGNSPSMSRTPVPVQTSPIPPAPIATA